MATDPSASEVDGDAAGASSHRLRSVAPWLLLAAAIGCGAAIRIGAAESLPYLHDRPAEGLLKSDPGLIHYLTSRIVAAGGWVPDDFRADPRIESPESTDIPAMFTVGQEFLVAWSYLALCGRVPLHIVALYVMSLVASLSAIGVFGLAGELTRSRRWAALAAGLYVLSYANYRTIGFLYIREDLSLPLFALHLWLLARACRVGRAAPMAGAGLAAAAALATWHAMTFVFSVEVACLLAWWLRTGRSPFAPASGWLFTAVLGGVAICVPVLRAKLFLLSPAYVALVAMTFAPWLEKRLPAHAAARGAAQVVLLGALIGSARLLAASLGADDYRHVVDLLVAKLRYLGQRPADPALLSFDARLLWQGPFATGSPARLWWSLGVPVFAVPVAGLASVRRWWRGDGAATEPVLAALACALLVLALLVDRVLAIAGMLAPVVGVVTFRSLVAGMGVQRRLVIGTALLAVQVAVFCLVIGDFGLRLWYDTGHQAALVRITRFVRSHLPPGAVIATDYVNSTALLAHTDARVVLQPKYETNRSRRRIERFESAFYHESPDAFAWILRDEFDADYLLVDIGFLAFAAYEAGLPPTAHGPIPGTAAAALMAADVAALRRIPGYRLLAIAGGRTARMRLFELVPPERK
jgi:hypothetical protein